MKNIFHDKEWTILVAVSHTYCNITKAQRTTLKTNIGSAGITKRLSNKTSDDLGYSGDVYSMCRSYLKVAAYICKVVQIISFVIKKLNVQREVNSTSLLSTPNVFKVKPCTWSGLKNISENITTI